MKQKNIVLMVVAVGCGLVAAFLTSQMSAKPAVEKVEVIVAAKDLTVGMQLTKDDLKTSIKRKSVSKDAVPPNAIETEEELLEKRMTRTIHMEEMITKTDVTKGGVVSIPPGMNMVTLPIGLSQAVAGFVSPGSKVDVLASVRLENNLTALPILVNMLVLAIDGNVVTAEKGVNQTVSMVSFAVNRKQALLLELAKARNCSMSLLLRNPEEKENENDKGYNIEEVTTMLRDNKNPADIKDKDPNEAQPSKPLISPPAPKIEMVKVPAAIADIPAGTQITSDLIAEKFKLVELPKDLAADAVIDLAPLATDKQVLTTGLGKGQWLTKSLFGNAQPKAPPRDTDNPPKAVVEANKTRDVALHSTSGTKYFRYEEVAPGEWKMQGEVFPNQKPKAAPTPTPEKVD